MADPSTSTIGKGLEIRGEVTGDGALLVEGKVDGKIQLDRLTVKEGGVVEAEVEVKTAVIFGRASGNIAATDSIEVKASATVLGDVRAPSVTIEEGAVFRGNVHMDVDLPEDL